jgi:tetratricopeptide (TPR) repeat protein
MAQFRPLWPGDPPEAELGKGSATIVKARGLAPPTERERAYVEAASAYFHDWAVIDQPTRLAAWASAQERLHRDYPDDVDAAAFHALGIIATAPLDDPSFAAMKHAAEILEPLRREAPDHPGLLHYLLLAHDNPTMVDRAQGFADAYMRFADEVPEVGHAAAHLSVRLGRWEESILRNGVAAAAARKITVSGLAQTRYAHDQDFFVYSLLQAGWDRRAEGVLRQLARIPRFEETFATAYALAAAPARYHLEREDWEGAAHLGPPWPPDFPWQRFPVAQAITLFARGIGAARSGDEAGANAAATELARIQTALSRSDPYWASRVEAQRLALVAALAFSRGQTNEALDGMRAAATLEEAADKHPVSPGTVLPCRELLGDLLLELDRPGEALVEFEASLARAPNRFRALFQAGYAAGEADQMDKAFDYYARLVEQTEDAHSDRPQIKFAKDELRRRPPGR